jgi:hypothetical protein
MPDLPGIDEVGITLDDLVRLVEGMTGGMDDLTALQVAVGVAERLGELGDHLVGHFVDQARRSGASWTTIGASMGVTKQAAQKRFVPGPGDIPAQLLYSRFTPRAQRTVDEARRAAKRMKNAHVGTEHLLLGLMAAGGLAADAITAQGVSAKQVKARVARAGVPKVGTVPERVPFAAETKKALEVAVREALRRGHNYIGTEHVLIAVLADPSSLGARLLTVLGIGPDETVRRLDEALAAVAATRAV